MRERGAGSASDVLAFAAIVSVGLVLLATAPQFAEAGEMGIAMETARGVILTTGVVSAGELGGISYWMGLSSFSSSIELKDRTIAQLVGECWVLRKSRASLVRDNMEESLRRTVSDLMATLVGERFCYRWKAEVLSIDGSDPLFTVTAEDLRGRGRFLCSDAVVVPFSPVFAEAVSLDELAIRVSVELWSG